MAFVLPHNLVHFVLIVAKCNVNPLLNVRLLKDFPVLIVAKCNVNKVTNCDGYNSKSY